MNTKTDISAAYVGSTGVDKLCLGNEVVWQNTPPTPVPYDEQYLTFNITSGGTLGFKKSNTNAPTVTIYYKVNSGNWTAITTTTAFTLFNVEAGDVVKFKGDNPTYCNNSGMTQFNEFLGTSKADICGNIMSIVNSTGFTQLEDTIPWVPEDHNYCFVMLFYGYRGVGDASNLVLPIDAVSKFMYAHMFDSTYITTPPALPATTLEEGCYQQIFNKCANLATAPALPATTMVKNCYRNMFQECTSLSQAPVLSATTLAQDCYTYMFRGCTSLTQAPELPATTLANNCYSYMFYGCTSLASAPVLPATTLVTGCYLGMFSGCTSLNTITCLATNPSTALTKYWTTNVASIGTFYKDANASGWTRGTSGIPTSWTVQDYVDPATIPVLKIAGQSITGTSAGGGNYEWGDLAQYSGTSFTIEVGGIPITADTWDYSENYIDECGTESEISLDTGATTSVFEVYSGYIGYVSYDPNNNHVYYSSYDDNSSDDPQTICECGGWCWDEENQECYECPQPSCEDQGLCDDGEGNCVECPDTCDDWENMGYSSYEDCRCQEYGEGCEEEGDPCDDYEGAGYSSYEECTCAERGENCEEESGEPEESGE